MSDPKGETPHPDHPHEDEFALELPLEHEGAAPEEPLALHEAGEEPHPFDALNLSASTEEFHFSGPVEDLDFTEPADFTFPTEHAAEAASESSADMSGVEHVGAEHYFGAEEDTHHAEAVGEELSLDAEPEADAVPELDLDDGEAEAKPKRELPAWVYTLQWVTVGLLAAGSLIAIIASIIWVEKPDTVTLVLNIACPLMLALIPFALWRSSHRWVKPAVSALYTMLLVLSVVVLIGGTWVEGMELSRFRWQFKPRPGYTTPPPPPTPAAADEAAPAGDAAKPAPAGDAAKPDGSAAPAK